MSSTRQKMEEKAKELSIVAVISILTIVLATSAGVVQASEWQEPHPNASSGAHYEHVGGMVGEESKVSNASPGRHSKVIYGQNLSAKNIPKQVVLTEKDNGSSVNVCKGQKMIIELASNPSTGYRWEVREIDKGILRLRSIEFGKPETDLFGAPQKQVFQFEVIDKGETIISLVYWRPWEKIPMDTYSVNIKSELTTVSIGVYNDTTKLEESVSGKLTEAEEEYYKNITKLEESGPGELTKAEKEYYKNIKKLEWAGPEGTAPTSYEEWRGKFPTPIPPDEISPIERVDLLHESMSEIGPPHPAFTPLLGEPEKPATTPSISKYLTLLNGDLWDNNPDLRWRIWRWADEIYLQTGRTMEIWKCSPICSKEAIRNWLNDQHFNYGAGGCVIIGDQDVPWYEIPGHYDAWGNWWGAEEFPIDLYYMDLDGTWTDSDSDGKFDSHTGDVGPEIWVGRLTASSITTCGSEADLLINYFDKNHRYRALKAPLVLNDRALAYIDDDWANGNWDIDDAYPCYTLVDDCSVTRENDYRNRIKTGNYELVHVMVHSWSGGHRFKICSGTWEPGYYYSSELCSDDPQPVFYNLFACSNARYVDGNYMGGTYIFTPTAGLVAVGSTKTGSMLYFNDFYSKLGSGWNFGDSYLYWFNQRASGGFAPIEKDWHYGMTLLGDPTLKLSRFVHSIPDWENIGGLTPSCPSICGMRGWTGGYDSVHAMVRGMDDNIYHRLMDPSGSWTSWTAIGGLSSSGPTLHHCEFDNKVHVVVRGMDSGIYHRSVNQDGTGWSAWERLSGLTPSCPAITNFDGKLYLFVRGTDNRIYYRWLDASGWSGWNVLSGLTTSGPSITHAIGSWDKLYLAVRGMDNAIYFRSMDRSGTWSPWQNLGGLTPSCPSLTWHGDYLHLMVRGMDDGIYYRSSYHGGSNWSGWKKLPGRMSSGAGMHSGPGTPPTSNSVELFALVRGTDNNIYFSKIFNTRPACPPPGEEPVKKID